MYLENQIRRKANGPIERDEIQAAVNDAKWQSVRKKLKGKPLEVRLSL